MSNIDTIVFDLGGVLLDLDRDASVESFRKLGYPQADKLLDPYRQSGPFLKLEKGEISPVDLCDIIREDAGRYISNDDIYSALNNFVLGVPQYKLDMLLDLRKRKKVYMLSNTNAIVFPVVERRVFSQGGHVIGDYFDRLFLSYIMRAVKPTELIYEMMIAESGLVPERTLFLDDSEANIATAEKLGFNTRLVAEHEDFRGIFDGI